jgi:hypothetical protein
MIPGISVYLRVLVPKPPIAASHRVILPVNLADGNPATGAR